MKLGVLYKRTAILQKALKPNIFVRIFHHDLNFNILVESIFHAADSKLQLNAVLYCTIQYYFCYTRDAVTPQSVDHTRNLVKLVTFILKGTALLWEQALIFAGIINAKWADGKDKIYWAPNFRQAVKFCRESDIYVQNNSTNLMLASWVIWVITISIKFVVWNVWVYVCLHGRSETRSNNILIINTYICIYIYIYAREMR